MTAWDLQPVSEVGAVLWALILGSKGQNGVKLQNIHSWCPPRIGELLGVEKPVHLVSEVL